MEEASEEVREQLFGKGIGDIFDLRLVDEVLTAEEAEAAGQDPTEVEPHTHVMRMLVKDVQAKEKPDTDDEFAKTLGFETWAEAEAQVRASIARQLADEAFEAQRDELVDKLIEGATFDVPAILVQRRKSGLLEDLGVDLRRQGMTVERYLAMLDARGTREDFEKELDASALRGVKRDLVLERLLEQRGTEVSDEEFGEAVRHLAARRRLDLPRFRREMGEEWLAQLPLPAGARQGAARDARGPDRYRGRERGRGGRGGARGPRGGRDAGRRRGSRRGGRRHDGRGRLSPAAAATLPFGTQGATKPDPHGAKV